MLPELPRPVSMTDLHCLAERMGVTIRRVPAGPGVPAAYYDHHARTIYTRREQTVESYRTALAHELGHAYYGHHPPASRAEHSRQEAQADRYAANLLISPTEYALAERLYGPHPGAIADELEVTRHLVEVWQATHERTRAS